MFSVLKHRRSGKYEITPEVFVKDYSRDFWEVVWSGEATDREHAWGLYTGLVKC